MKYIAALFKKAWFILLIGLLLIGSSVWFLGKKVALSGEARLFIIAIAAIFLLLIYIMMRMLTAAKSSQRLETAMLGAGGVATAVRPDKRQEIEQLKLRMTEAIGTLKSSKMAKGRKGKNVLYILPWYVIIGSSGAGKSTALAKSDLNFPYLDPSGKGIRGIGGTRNCDWWFNSDAILLDTAGRYTTEADDREEWLAFLDQLKKCRPQKPINGVIVAVSVPELMNATDDQLTDHARMVRTRVDELINRLGISFPVYLLFTKCDLLDGFVETFDDLKKSERGQVWGATFSADDERPARSRFDKDFDVLVQTLSDLRLRRLTTQEKPESRQKVYIFPLEFRAAQQALSDFVSQVFQPNPYQEQPLFRGFYFSSGTQEGTPLELVMSRLMEMYRLPTPLGAKSEALGESKSYFIHDLFTKIIIPDQNLAGPSLTKSRKASRLQIYLGFGTAAVCALWLIGAGISFFSNRAWLTKVNPRITAVAEPSSAGIMPQLNALESLRSLLDTVETGGRPLRRRWGLYQGNEVLEVGSSVYFNRFRDIFFQRSGDELVSQIKNSRSTDPESVKRYYDQFRLYLILTHPKIVDSLEIANCLTGSVASLTPGDQRAEFDHLVSQQVVYYIAHRDRAPSLPENAAAMDCARRFLSQYLTADLYYEIRLAQFSKGLSPQGLREIRVAKPLQSEATVPGAYTEAGWKVMRQALGFEGPDKIHDIVIENLYQSPDSVHSAKVKYAGQMMDLYVAGIGDSWAKFLQSIGCRVDKPDDLNAVTGITGIDSVLRTASRATKLEGLDAVRQKKLDGRFDAVRAFAGDTARTSKKDGDGVWEKYKEQITMLRMAAIKPSSGNAKKELVAAKNFAVSQINGVLSDFSPEAQEVVCLLLLNPVHSLDVTAVDPPRGGPKIAGWKDEVVKSFEDLADKYPFNPSRQENASLSDVAKFFRTDGGTIWKYRADSLANWVTEGGVLKNQDDLDCPKGLRPIAESVRSAAKIRDALFQDNDRNVTVKFTVRVKVSGPGATPINASYFKFDGISKKWETGPEQLEQVTWPGSGAGDARLSVSGRKGDMTVAEGKGPWALFRLLGKAKTSSVVSQQCQYDWIVAYPANSHDSIDVHVTIEALPNPFEPDLFSGFRKSLR